MLNFEILSLIMEFLKEERKEENRLVKITEYYFSKIVWTHLESDKIKKKNTHQNA